ncbi:hypothetical protein N7537_010412 [Penicillium hordei]|uniref:Actin cortical patch SUR7/pH-response regulator PalI n=1 Tax=Penicillium hordei TaxID=40994 RepID=A0AAD6DUK7_9EURO|nr:uncharacterized protein N7537_010412 [Penicillium hordei]KAJ5593508.1 hypothetical protein N7537_010412 [Penicillium hordei]
MLFAIFFIQLIFHQELSDLHLRRGLSIAGVDTSTVTSGATDAANSVTKIAAHEIAQASATAQTTVDQASEHLKTLSEDLKLHLPAYYAVGLWGYCQGDNSTGPFANCSKPSTSFSFNLLEIFGSASAEINDILLDKDNKILAGYHDVSRWTVSAYIIGFVFTSATIIIQVFLFVFPKVKILLVASSILAAAFITGASIGATVIYGLLTGGIARVLQPLGAHASLGASTFTATWLARCGSFASRASTTVYVVL